MSVMTGPKRSREPATRASPGEHAGAPARRGSGEVRRCYYVRAAARAARGGNYSTRSDKRSEREDTS